MRRAGLFMSEVLKNRRIFGAGFLCEVNTFAAFPVAMSDFTSCCYFRSGEYGDNNHYYLQPLLTMKKAVEGAGGTFLEGLCAGAQPGGRVQQAVYEEIRDNILEDLKRQMPVDAVFLYLHGAMVSEECDDCEGDIIARVRDIVGPDVFIGTQMDPHAHLSEEMVEKSDAQIWIKEYPHTDYNERAQDMFQLMQASLLRQVKIKTSVVDCFMIDMFPTTIGPMKVLLDEVKHIEVTDPKILSISIIHGFPWGDVADMGTKVLVLTDNAEAYGLEVGRMIADKLRAAIGNFRTKSYSVEEALDWSLSTDAKLPVTLADFSDNTGLGALGDSTFIMEAVYKRGMTNVAISPLYDPEAVAKSIEAGEGNVIDITIGGKGEYSGKPLPLEGAEVIKIDPDLTVDFAGATAHYGQAVALKCKDNFVVVNSERVQTFSTECFTKMGIDPSQMTVLVAKSSEHFRHSLSQLGGDILTVSTSAAMSLDFSTIPYRKVVRPLLPLVPDAESKHAYEQQDTPAMQARL